ncbi:MAG TPA: hypothetical protein VK249_10475 [Anaerolineales bacterium]|nr:hypothetical protein [Anaerolineales bacterium]
MAQLTLDKNTTSSAAVTLALGFWSAVLVIIFNVLSSILMIPSWFLYPILPWQGIESYASTFDFFQIASMIPGFLVVIPFLPMMAAVHYSSPPGRKAYSMLGVAFASIAVAMLGFQYYSQFTVVRYNLMSGEEPTLGLFVLGNPHSFFWPLETLGYGFMGLSTLFAAFAFFGGPLECWIRALFIVNGVLGIGGMIAYPLEIPTVAVLCGLSLWALIFPALTILLAIRFRRGMHRGV